jgi:hypothetical protein
MPWWKKHSDQFVLFWWDAGMFAIAAAGAAWIWQRRRKQSATGDTSRELKR